MKRILFSILFLLFLFTGVGCTEEDASDAETDPSGNSKSLSGENLVFAPSGFSPYIEISGKTHLRFAFSFFPEGSGFDFDQKTVSIPCTFLSSRISEDVDVQLSAPLEEECDTLYTITFDDDAESFTLEGIVVPLNSSYDRFADDFEITISVDGVKDAANGDLLTSAGGKLEDFYDLILEKRVPLAPSP